MDQLVFDSAESVCGLSNTEITALQPQLSPRQEDALLKCLIENNEKLQAKLTEEQQALAQASQAAQCCLRQVWKAIPEEHRNELAPFFADIAKDIQVDSNTEELPADD